MDGCGCVFMKGVDGWVCFRASHLVTVMTLCRFRDVILCCKLKTRGMSSLGVKTCLTMVGGVKNTHMYTSKADGFLLTRYWTPVRGCVSVADVTRIYHHFCRHSFSKH